MAALKRGRARGATAGRTARAAGGSACRCRLRSPARTLGAALPTRVDFPVVGPVTVTGQTRTGRTATASRAAATEQPPGDGFARSRRRRLDRAAWQPRAPARAAMGKCRPGEGQRRVSSRTSRTSGGVVDAIAPDPRSDSSGALLGARRCIPEPDSPRSRAPTQATEIPGRGLQARFHV
jgi:hypothetical protein